MSFNQCTFIGRITKDVDNRFTGTGKQVVSFTIACNEKFGGEDHVEFVNCVTWEQNAKFVADYLGKGSLVLVSGRMQTRKWKDKEGKDRDKTEIIAQTVKNLSPKPHSAAPSDHGIPVPPTTEDDCPF
jgi:single-strand DNA-binding protein